MAAASDVSKHFPKITSPASARFRKMCAKSDFLHRDVNSAVAMDVTLKICVKKLPVILVVPVHVRGVSIKSKMLLNKVLITWTFLQ